MDQGSSSNRQDLIRNAILFLNDPKVQTSTLTSKIQFLESKGLTETEIQNALQQASSSSSSATAGFGGSGSERRTDFRDYGVGGGRQMMAPEVPRRDWRDLFIMAVVSGGVMYGMATLAKKYLLPHLQPPSSTTFQQTSQSLTDQYDEASRLLTELTSRTEELQKGIEGDRERVVGVLGEVEEAVKGVRDGEERWREELREIREEVESVRELVPKMIEKHSATQSSALSDLQSELRSLKTLLISRQSQATPAAATSKGNGISSTQAAADALLRKGKSGIPAWQMAPPPASSGGGGGSGVSSSSGSLSGSGVLEKGEVEGENGSG